MALNMQNVLTMMDQVKGSLVILLTWHKAGMTLSRNLDLEMHIFNFALSVFKFLLSSKYAPPAHLLLML